MYPSLCHNCLPPPGGHLMVAKCFRKGTKTSGEKSRSPGGQPHILHRPKTGEATGSVAGIFSPCSQPEGPHLSLFHSHACQKRSPRDRLCCPAGQVQTHSVYPAPGPPTRVWPVSPSRAAFSSRSRGPGTLGALGNSIYNVLSGSDGSANRQEGLWIGALVRWALSPPLG